MRWSGNGIGEGFGVPGLAPHCGPGHSGCGCRQPIHDDRNFLGGQLISECNDGQREPDGPFGVENRRSDVRNWEALGLPQLEEEIVIDVTDISGVLAAGPADGHRIKCGRRAARGSRGPVPRQGPDVPCRLAASHDVSELVDPERTLANANMSPRERAPPPVRSSSASSR